MANVDNQVGLCVRVETHSGGSKYYAWGDGIKFSGFVNGYAGDIEKILRRMIKAPQEPPPKAVNTARVVFEHFEAYLRHIGVIGGDDFVGTSVELDEPDDPFKATLYIEMTTRQIVVFDRIVSDGKLDLGPAEPGWEVVIEAEYRGYDGVDGEGQHRVVRRLVFKGRIDPNVVWGELMRVVRHAFNALPEE
jgi:hypothetical protein